MAHPRWIGALRLLRPLNAVMFLAGVALGGLLGAGPEAFVGSSVAPLLLAMASAALIGAGANAVNDVFDLDIDRINRPDRPLPSGAVSVRAARWLWGGMSAVGIGLGLLVSSLHFWIAVGAAVLLYSYSAWLKRVPLAGNLAVALILGVAILYGGLAVAPATGALWLGAGFAFASTLAREVTKDIEDVAGDAADGARTLPLAAGARLAVGVVLAVIGTTVVAFPLGLPALGSDFLALALPAAGLLLASAWTLASADEATRPAHAGRASSLLKGAMLAGIVALAGAHVLS